MMKLEITADKVKEAAAKCPQAEATLKTLFPEVFKGDEYFDFGEKVEISVSSRDTPFFIGLNFAPPGLRNKCLVMSSLWRVNVVEHDGFTIIIPTKK